MKKFLVILILTFAVLLFGCAALSDDSIGSSKETSVVNETKVATSLIFIERVKLVVKDESLSNKEVTLNKFYDKDSNKLIYVIYDDDDIQTFVTEPKGTEDFIYK